MKSVEFIDLLFKTRTVVADYFNGKRSFGSKFPVKSLHMHNKFDLTLVSRDETYNTIIWKNRQTSYSEAFQRNRAIDNPPCFKPWYFASLQLPAMVFCISGMLPHCEGLLFHLGKIHHPLLGQLPTITITVPPFGS